MEAQQPGFSPFPSPKDELRAFEALQKNLLSYYQHFVEDTRREHTVVVVPSLTMHPGELAKIPGVEHYEERLLTQTMVLRYPRTRVVYITSRAVDPTIIDYYLHLLHGIPASHARKRLLLLDTHDTSPKPLTQKILERPRMIERIRGAIPAPYMGHIACFNSTDLERKLALRIGLPLYACDPELGDLGSKSGSRRVFKEADVPLPAGREDIRDQGDLAEAVGDLWDERPDSRRYVVKLNEGFSGEGNAILERSDLGERPSGASAVRNAVNKALPKLKFEAPNETWERFGAAFDEMGGICEEWVDGEDKRSPSIQCRVSP
ncbi:MAG: carboxylate-amine ligase, partial [Myxococcota bacterium]|nr:carboxylate-amine ligase [Myxococcota bacterium]